MKRTSIERKETSDVIIMNNGTVEILGMCPERAYDEMNVYIRVVVDGDDSSELVSWIPATLLLQMANCILRDKFHMHTDSRRAVDSDHMEDCDTMNIVYVDNNNGVDIITFSCSGFIHIMEVDECGFMNLISTMIHQSEFAISANRIINNRIHQANRMRKLIKKYDVNYIVFTCIDDNPPNYGPGFKEFEISIDFNTKGTIPKYAYDREFRYREVLYLSPFEKEYQTQMNKICRSHNYKFVNYNHDKTIKEFNMALSKMN